MMKLLDNLLRLVKLKKRRADFEPNTVSFKWLEQFNVENIRNDFAYRFSEYGIQIDNIESLNEELRYKYFWLKSVSRDGYQREAYLNKLLPIINDKDLDRVILRAFDWVPQIRTVAISWINENKNRLRHETLKYFVKALEYGMNKSNQVAEPVLVDLVNSISEDVFSSGTYKSLTPAERKFVVKRLIESQKIKNWIDIIMSDSDPHIRLLGYMSIPSEEIVNRREMLKDKNPRIRMLFLKKCKSLTKEDLIKSSYDRNAVVRSFSRFELREKFNFDIVHEYRCQTDIYKKIFLCDLSSADDIDFFVELTKNRLAAFKLRGMKSLISINKEDLLVDNRILFQHSSRKVKRLYLSIVVNYHNYESFNKIVSDFGGDVEFSKTGVLALISRRGLYWWLTKRIEYYLNDPVDSRSYYDILEIIRKNAEAGVRHSDPIEYLRILTSQITDEGLKKEVEFCIRK
jgi:hypothetical protein